MSARDDLYDAAVRDDICDCYPGGADEVNARIDAFRDEVLREAVARIRANLVGAAQHKRTDDGERYFVVTTAQEAADLIDPDKEQR